MLNLQNKTPPPPQQTTPAPQPPPSYPWPILPPTLPPSRPPTPQPPQPQPRYSAQTELALELLRILPGVALEPPRPTLASLIRDGEKTGPQVTGHLVQALLRNLDIKKYNAGLIDQEVEYGSCAIGGAYLAVMYGGPPPPKVGLPFFTQEAVEAKLTDALGYNPYDTKVPCLWNGVGYTDPQLVRNMMAKSAAEIARECDFPRVDTTLGNLVEQLNDTYNLTRAEIATLVERLGY